MLLPIGTIVRNLHTGDEGRIVAIDDDMAIVELFDDNDRYPIPMQSLVRSEEFFGTIDFDRELTAAHRHKPKQKKSNFTNISSKNTDFGENNTQQSANNTEKMLVFKPNLANIPSKPMGTNW